MLIAVLDNIRSAHNVASIFRTADGTGWGKIYLCGITPGPVDEFGRTRADFTKVALGAERNVAWETKPDVIAVICRLKESGARIFAVEQDSRAVPYYSARWAREQDAVLIFGQERDGLSDKVLRLADEILEIPMFGEKESLNVSVAFGVVAYHFVLGSRV